MGDRVVFVEKAPEVFFFVFLCEVKTSCFRWASDKCFHFLTISGCYCFCCEMFWKSLSSWGIKWFVISSLLAREMLHWREGKYIEYNVEIITFLIVIKNLLYIYFLFAWISLLIYLFKFWTNHTLLICWMCFCFLISLVAIFFFLICFEKKSSGRLYFINLSRLNYSHRYVAIYVFNFSTCI